MSYLDDKTTTVALTPSPTPQVPGSSASLVVDGVATPLPPNWDFFRSANGSVIPANAADYTAAITHNGFVGIGITVNPIAPLEFGDPVRNDVIRIFDGGGTNPHQFSGLGFDGTGAVSGMRYQTNNLGYRHSFYGGVDAATSKQFAQIGNRYLTVGDPSAAIGEGHFVIENSGDDGFIDFRSPNAAPGNKIQGRIMFNAYSGNAGTSGTSLSFQTAEIIPGSVLTNRLQIHGSGDITVSNKANPYDELTATHAAFTVNGAVRVKGGPIIPGNTTRQTGGLVFGADNVANQSVSTLTQDSDGGISSLGDGNLTFYVNGAIGGSLNNGGIWSKPGGGLWAATSDIRTKRDATSYDFSPSAALELEPIEFYYNGLGGTVDDGRMHVGFSAQDLLEAGFDEWVTPGTHNIDGSLWVEGDDEANRVLTVDTSHLTIELLGICKSQRKMIQALEARVDALEGGTKTTAKTTNRK